MQNLTVYDTKFLLPILKEKDLRLRAESFILLLKDNENQDNVLKILFSIPSPFGIKNKRLLENIRIVEQKDVKEAKPFIISLNQRKSFWNRKLRANASRLLEKWDVE
jgi:hypothetical protein